MNPITKVALGLLGALIVVYGVFAIYEGSWTLSKSVISHQQKLNQQIINNDNQNTQHGNANQQGELSAFNNDNDQLLGLPLGPQAHAVANDMCSTGAQMDANTAGWKGYDENWFRANCAGGTVASTSKYFTS
jgi:hypothetical protein